MNLDGEMFLDDDPYCAKCGHAATLHGNDDGSCTAEIENLDNMRVFSSKLLVTKFLPCDCMAFYFYRPPTMSIIEDGANPNKPRFISIDE